MKLIEVLRVAAAAVIQAEPELTEYDSALGDGDCGIGMRDGFSAVQAALADCDTASPKEILNKTARTLISAMGGTSGAIYGTAFLRMTKAAGGVENYDLVKVGEILEAGLNGVKARGENTQVGDKTLVDALEPAIRAFQEQAAVGADLKTACRAAAVAAKAGSDSTVNLIARKGRASYLGERSIGHRDAGSYGIYVIADAIARAAENLPE